MTLIRTIAIYKQRFERGLSWISLWQSLAIGVIALQVLGINLLFIFPIMLIGFLVVMLIGYVDFKKGIWLEENLYSAKYLNPYIREIGDGINEIIELLKEKKKV